MNALLVRVGADSTKAGGKWNGPVDSRNNEFVYVAIPEPRDSDPTLRKPYSILQPALDQFGLKLPTHLRRQDMHLDPDFQHLTYGDSSERAKQLKASLVHDGRVEGLLVFYAGLKEICCSNRLMYAIIGVLVVDRLAPAVEIAERDPDINAHARRVVPGADEVIVYGRPGESGRLNRCLPIGEYRDSAYRLRRDLLEEWGGLSVKDGWLQRSGRLPRFLDPERFRVWLEKQSPILMQANN